MKMMMMIVCNNDDDDFKVDGVFHVAGGKEGVAWTDQVENDDDGDGDDDMMMMTIVMISPCSGILHRTDLSSPSTTCRCWPGTPFQRHGMLPDIWHLAECK